MHCCLQYIAYQDLFGPANASQLDQLVLQVCVRVCGGEVCVCVYVRAFVRAFVRAWWRTREFLFLYFENLLFSCDDRNARSRSSTVW